MNNIIPKNTVIVAMLLMLVVLSAVAVVYCTHETRKLFSQLQISYLKRDSLKIIKTQLLLEQSAFATYGRIDKIARDSLNMRVPNSKDIIMVQQ